MGQWKGKYLELLEIAIEEEGGDQMDWPELLAIHEKREQARLLEAVCRLDKPSPPPPAAPLFPDVRTALYRHFDEWGDLLYVGISLSPIARLRQHRRSAHWMEEIVRVEIEWHPSRREALAREREAIEREDPKHNIDGKPRVRRAI